MGVCACHETGVTSTGNRRRLGIAALLGLLAAADTALAADPGWARIQTVAHGSPAAIGSTSNGCIRGASALPATGVGYVSIRRERNRYYGHPRTLRLIRHLGEAMHRRHSELIMIGDLAQPRGGRMPTSHVSHQNGLDVDVWLTLAHSPQQALLSTPEARDPPSMLADNGRDVNARFGPDQEFLIRIAAEDPSVDRLLVNPGIKNALCQRERDAAWLHKVRPWWGHDAHMHVRLKCPKDSPYCAQQAPIPAGNGCGAELAWWFSPEAHTPRKSTAKAAPQPPAQCRMLLSESSARR